MTDGGGHPCPEHLRQDLVRMLPEKPALLVLDFDGVLTDDHVYVREDGREMVACTRGDGMGTTLLVRAGFPVLVISTEKNLVVAARCAKLKVECIQGMADKTAEFQRILAERFYLPSDVVFVGNDVNDLGCVRLAGCGLAVLDAHPLLKKAARGVLSHPGGRGAVREVAEMILFKLGHEIVYNASDRTR
ncbi:MAG TPA: HAD hydrolase family protein [Planctomycetota bacterium]|nr:HAD hydrolase family protein [Planctomycetota bacterium]